MGNELVGRKVRDLFGTEGVVVRWEPLGAGMCDALVREESGRECWFGSSNLRPTDGLGPLPSRREAQLRAAAGTLDDLRKIRGGLVTEVRERKPWPGCEHGKAILGRAIDGAITETKALLEGHR